MQRCFGLANGQSPETSCQLACVLDSQRDEALRDFFGFTIFVVGFVPTQPDGIVSNNRWNRVRDHQRLSALIHQWGTDLAGIDQVQQRHPSLGKSLDLLAWRIPEK